MGAKLADAQPLKANQNLSNRGVQLFGAGFILTPDEAAALGNPAIVKDYCNGRDLTDTPRGVKVIDAFGLSADQLRLQFPATFQWLLERVKPERDQNNRASYRDNWWFFGEPRKVLRQQLANLPRYIATVETAKHRVFQFLDASILPDNRLVAIALDDAFCLGVLSSHVHHVWALATGGTLEDRPVYTKSICFETFPFPSEDTGLTPALREKISALAEQIDQHRKRVLGLLPSTASSHAHTAPAHHAPANPLFQQDNQPLALMNKAQAAINSVSTMTTASPAKPDKSLTLTGLYNVLQALRVGRALTAKEKHIHSAGLVGVLKTLHDELDAAVLAAYGWGDLAHMPSPSQAKDELLQRLVAMNQRRALEEANAQVRWLRPAFQNPLSKTELPMQVQQALEVDLASNPASRAKLPESWPATLPEQVKAVVQVLSRNPGALTLAQIAAHFGTSASLKKSLPTLLQTLEALGRAHRVAANGAELWRA
ncbi:type IIL restriction-modification enzyme MmeI [Rhodoferax sp.]|uniref:type IIL restriction-modification enzyme MmeI n=1 Tax=Rhodoferax sp. TaxID=50421 RepID=UPI003450116C